MNRTSINFKFLTMSTTFKELSEWLSQENLQIPEKQKQEKTFMNIAGIGHLENNWSRIYAYFFNPKEKHQLGRLFIDVFRALIEKTSGKAAPNLDSFSIIREYPTEDGKRVDLLIKNEEEAIIIENKVYASLYNNLPSYWESVKVPNKIGVVLSLHKILVKDTNFINITHEEFAKAIDEVLPQYCSFANQKVLCFLQDFINNIENETHAMNEEELKFYYSLDNREKINRLSEIRSNIINHISKTIENKELINSALQNNGLNLTLREKNNKEYTYYCYNIGEKFSKEIMLTLKYDSLWNYNSHGCRINIYLELQGDIMRYANEHVEFLKEKGIETNPKLAHKNCYWHFQECVIPFTPDELSDKAIIIDKIVTTIKESGLYDKGQRIIEYFKQRENS